MKKILITSIIAVMSPIVSAQTVPNAFGTQALPTLKLGVNPLPNRLPPHIGMLNTTQVPGIASIAPLNGEVRVLPGKKMKKKELTQPETRIKTHEQVADTALPSEPVKAKLKPEPNISKDEAYSNPGQPYYPTWPTTPDAVQIGGSAQQSGDGKNNNFGKLFQ